MLVQSITQRRHTGGIIALIVAALTALSLAACSDSSGKDDSSSDSGRTVQVASTLGGDVIVPVSPKRVVVLDSTVLETMSALDIPSDVVAGVVKDDIKPLLPDYATDKNTDVGLPEERSINLEAVDAIKPDLIITGWRYSANAVDGIKDLGAPVLELSGQTQTYTRLRDIITGLGKVFDKEKGAETLSDTMEKTFAQTREATSKAGKGMVVMSSGGGLFSYGPGEDSRYGIMYDALGIQPAQVSNGAPQEHGAELSFEALRSANPDWIYVIDRDASFGVEGEFTPARQVLNNDLVKATTAGSKNHIVFFNPQQSYLGEGSVTYMDGATLITKSINDAKN